MIYVKHFMKLLTNVWIFILWLNLYTLGYADIPHAIFHNSICIKPNQGYHYQTCHDITVTIGHFILVIPKNFDTDLASIPRWLWEFIAPSRSDFIPASILHDYLYICHNGYGRSEADDIFYETLKYSGVSVFRAYEMYAAVRIFGGKNYTDDKLCSYKIAHMVKKYGTCTKV